MLGILNLENFLVLLVLLALGLVDKSHGDGGITSIEGTTTQVVEEAEVSFTTEVNSMAVENVTEMNWMKAAEMEYAKKNIEIGWGRGLTANTGTSDCCYGDINQDCSQNCPIDVVKCTLSCGSLLLPENPAQDDEYTTQLTAPTDGLVWLRVAITDLRLKDQISVSYTEGGEAVSNVTCESFTKTEMEKYFVSEAEELFVTYRTLPVPSGGEKGCSAWDTPSGKLSFRAVARVTCNVEIPVGDDGLEGEIFSPGYPDGTYPPLRDCSWTIRAPSEGYGVGLFIDELDLNGFYGDHLRINAGGPNILASKGYLLTWSTSESQQHLKVFPGGVVTLYFHTGRHSAPTTHKGFQIEYRQYGNGSVPEETTTMGSPMPTPSDGQNVNASIYTAGKSPEEISKEQSTIKEALVGLANYFCKEENITLQNPINYQNVHIHVIMHCPSTWPYSSKCAEVILQIVAHTESGEYELTDTNIKKMWNKYGLNMNITHHGIRPYRQNPDVIIWWMVAMIGTLVIFVILLTAAWCIQKHIEYGKYVSQVKQSKKAAEKDDRRESKMFEYTSQGLPPFKVFDEEEEDDDNSFTNDHRDSCYDYDYFGSQGGSTYYSYNDGIGTSITGEKINHAFIPDEGEDLEEIDLGRADFKFEFTSGNRTRSSHNQNYDFPDHQNVIQIDNTLGDKLSETVL